jgi:hypothetical protein
VSLVFAMVICASPCASQDTDTIILKGGGKIQIDLNRSDLVDRVFYIDDPFFKAHVKPLSKEEYEATGNNYEFCKGGKTYLKDPLLVEDPSFPCNEGSGTNQFPFKMPEFVMQGEVSIYNADYEVVATFTPTMLDELSVSGKVALMGSAYNWSTEQLDAFSKSLKTGEGIVAGQTASETYIQIQSPLFSEQYN